MAINEVVYFGVERNNLLYMFLLSHLLIFEMCLNTLICFHLFV